MRGGCLHNPVPWGSRCGPGVALAGAGGAGERGQGEHLAKEQTEALLSEESSHFYKSSLIYRKHQLPNK